MNRRHVPSDGCCLEPEADLSLLPGQRGPLAPDGVCPVPSWQSHSPLFVDTYFLGDSLGCEVLVLAHLIPSFRGLNYYCDGGDRSDFALPSAPTGQRGPLRAGFSGFPTRPQSALHTTSRSKTAR